MGAFQYKALDKQGREKKGVLEGDSPKHIRQLLRDQGLSPLEVETMGERRNAIKTGQSIKKTVTLRGISSNDLSLLTRQLATLVRSGLPLESALQAVAQQTEKPRVQAILLGVRAKVVEGHSLASALEEFPSVFPPIYVATVNSGEKSGHLDEVLEGLADYTEGRRELQRKTGEALVYPIFVIMATLGIVAFLLAYVVPKVVQVYDSIEGELPFATRLLINLSDFIRDWWWLLAVIIIGSIIGFKLMMRQMDFRRQMHRRYLRLPLAGRIIRGLNTARFTRALSIQIGSGVPALEALQTSSQVIENLPMRESVEIATRKVREGSSINKALSAERIFPPITMHLIASGETSGRLGEMLERAAEGQERETESMISAFMSILQPLTILMMAGVVFYIVMAILLPILDLNQLVGV